jgi:hypothetical protein
LRKIGGKPKNTRNLVFFNSFAFSSFTLLINYQAQKKIAMALEIYGFFLGFGVVMYYLHQPKKAKVAQKK